MFRKILNSSRALLRTPGPALATFARAVGSHLANLWRRHEELLLDRPTYRAELLAASAAVLALADPPAALASALLALVALYVAAHGDRPDGPGPARAWAPPPPAPPGPVALWDRFDDDGPEAWR